MKLVQEFIIYMPKQVLSILIISLLLRLLAIFFISDVSKDFYWEYGEIARNIVNGNSYGLFYGEGLDIHSNPNVIPYKSAFMPPGYVIFLIPFMLIKKIVLRNILILIIQAIISVFTILLLYKLSLLFFSKTTSLIAIIIVSITPEFIYSVLSFTPTVIYHFLIIVLFLLLLTKNFNRKQLIIVGSIIAIIIYFRSEFILFALMLCGYFFLVKKFQHSLIIFAAVILLLFPWGLRNYLTFHKFVPLTTSFGLNLYRGNNPIDIGYWGDEKIINNIKGDDSFELNMNGAYKDSALSFIKNNPLGVIKNAGTKFVDFWFFNLSDKRTNNMLYLLPSIFILIFFIIGLIKSFSWEKYKYFYMFFIYSTLIVLIFFPMIRYQTMMKIMMIPFSSFGIENVFGILS